MRFTLQMGGREVLVLSRDRFVEFDALDSATSWLADYIVSPENLFALRAALASDPTYVELLRLDLADLVIELARLMTAGRLKWLAEPRNHRPWRWAFPGTPTFEIEDAGGSGEATDLVGEAEEVEEDESEYEEIKPEPVIPPEFPRLAKRQSDAVMYAQKKMGSELDLMRFVGEKQVPDSLVAQSYLDMANEQGMAVDEAASNVGATLDALAAGGDSPTPKSSIAESLPQMAAASGNTILAAADGLEKHAGSLLGGTEFQRPDSAMVPVFVEMASSQGVHVMNQAQQAGQVLDTLDGPLAEPANPSVLAPEFGIEATKQGDAISKVAQTTGESLEKLNEGEVEPPPPSDTAQGLKNLAEGQGNVINMAIAKSNETLDNFAATADERPDAPEPSNLATLIGSEGVAAGVVVTEAADEVARQLDEMLLGTDDGTAGDDETDGSGVGIQLVGPPGVSLEGLLFTIRLRDESGEERVLQSDAKGFVRMKGIPEEGFDIVGIADGSGLEIDNVRASKAMPPPEDDADAPPEGDG